MDSESSAAAIQTLTSSAPIERPWYELGLTDPVKGKAVRELYAKQMKALNDLIGVSNPSVVTVVVPYFHYEYDYTEHHFVDASTHGYSDLKSASAKHPSLAVVAGIPDAAAVLSEYVTNPNNQMEYRLYALTMLAYLDRGMAESLVKRVESDPKMKDLWNAIQRE